MNHPTITVNPTGEENPDHAYQKAQRMHEAKAILIDLRKDPKPRPSELRRSSAKSSP